MTIQLTQLFPYIVFILNRTTLPTYGMLGTLLGALALTRQTKSGSLRIRTSRRSFWILTALLLVWIYGLLLGFARGNNPAWVVQNFGGMILYVIGYFVLTDDRDKVKAIHAIHICALYTILLSIFLKLTLMFQPQLRELFHLLFGTFSFANSNLQFQPRIVIQGHLTFFLPIVFSFLLIIGTQTNKRAIQALYGGRLPLLYRYRLLSALLMLTCLTVVVIVNQSKGLMLAVTAILLLTTIAVAISARSGYRIKPLNFVILLIFAVAIAAGVNYLVYILSEGASGNSQRYRQLRVLWENTTLFGNGLGAEIPGANELRGNRSLENNETDKLYAVELIYMNIFHKFGIFALVILYAYAYVILRAMRKVMRASSDLQRGFGLAALAMMGFTVVALGNPLLFGPGPIILHIFALKLVE